MKTKPLDVLKLARDVLSIEMEGLKLVRDRLGKEFVAAVELLRIRLNAGGKIVVTGVGKNVHIGNKMAATFTSTGSTAVVLHPAEAMHGDLGLLDPRDVVLALSYSGGSEELINLMPVIQRTGVPIIGLSGDPRGPLAAYCKVLVPVKVRREACPFGMAPTSSTTATLAVGDALAMVLLQVRGFKKDDYARLHPGGAIGRALLLKVSDIMRTGERMARVKQGTLVRDAVLAMTSARAGSVVVVDKQNCVVGILTDGDLRRHIFNGSDIRHEIVDRIMSRKPITLNDQELAVQALAIYEKHAIDDLIIVDAEQRLVGMIDIQDLPKFKIL